MALLCRWASTCSVGGQRRAKAYQLKLDVRCLSNTQACRRQVVLIASTVVLAPWKFSDPTRAATFEASTAAPQPSSNLLGLRQYQSPDNSLRFLVPSSWKAVNSLDPASGILASFYNPDDPGAETLAVYVKPTSAARTEDLGSPQDIGLALAGTAAFGQLEDAYASRHADGRTYYSVRVQFSGATAGRFGAVIECRCTAVLQGQQYTLRITTTRYQWLAEPSVRQVLRDVVDSFLMSPRSSGDTSRTSMAYIMV